RRGALAPRYEAAAERTTEIPAARHDLLPTGYAFGAIQTTRGCPLNCSFCSVTPFNGARYRHRPIADVVEEFRTIHEKYVLVVDDNLIGTSAIHVARAKTLFRAMIAARLPHKWIAQVTVNMGDDDELLSLAAKAGCVGTFIGFESQTAEGLAEIGKKFNIVKGRDLGASVRRIQQHGILVVGSFIIGLDNDERGIGRRIADAARHYGVDMLNTLFLTPLPGTRLWDTMEAQGRISTEAFPQDWQYYTLTFPVAEYKHLSRREICQEMECCDRTFYSPWRMLRRLWRSVRHWHHPFISLVGNLSYRAGLSSNRKAYRAFIATRDEKCNVATHPDGQSISLPIAGFVGQPDAAGLE
ncbi:MAG: radical SAM protein, partial [Tepidisphaeraceae bacterium]